MISRRNTVISNITIVATIKGISGSNRKAHMIVYVAAIQVTESSDNLVLPMITTKESSSKYVVA